MRAAETEPGTVADVHYDFTQFGLDRSQATLARSLRTSLIVEPKNGKLPPVTARRKEDSGGARRRGQAARRPLGLGAEQSARRPLLIMAGPGPPMMDAAYNSNYHIVQAPGYVMILTEMIHDVRIIPLDGRPQPPESGASVDGGLTRALGRRDARRRDDQLQREESAARIHREHEGDRAPPPCGRRHDRVQVHGRGQEHVGDARGRSRP